MFRYFASNNLVANANKTAFLLIRPNGKKEEASYNINLGGSLIEESKSERILGIQVQNDLKWEDHVDKVIGKVNHGLYTLRRLQPFLGKKTLGTISQGLIMSHFRYGCSIYQSEFIRLSQSDPMNSTLHRLQLKQNEMLRIILKHRRSDKVSIEKMLQDTKNMSLNQIACLNVLMDTWKALKLNIPSISSCFEYRNSKRYSDMFKPVEDKNSFVSKATELWNMSSERFKNTTLTKVAKMEAIKIVKKLPL